MVNLLVGPKGSGKTPVLIEKANENEKTEHGSVIFLKKTHRNTKEISFNIRTVCMEDFPNINNLDRYIGFLYGIYSSNTDIKQIYIDEVFKIDQIGLDNLDVLLNSIETMSKEYNINFYVSISATKEEVSKVDLTECNITYF
ncbi:MAG TPA: ATP-binding protein [Candidatus Dorea intestinavium]|nr:ATP-binding protein [Candidatus Dorea intestinavium]